MMTREVLTLPRPKKGSEPRDDIAVKIDRKLALLAKAVAAFRNITLAEYLTEKFREGITADFDNLPRENKQAQRNGKN